MPWGPWVPTAFFHSLSRITEEESKGETTASEAASCVFYLLHRVPHDGAFVLSQCLAQ